MLVFILDNGFLERSDVNFTVYRKASSGEVLFGLFYLYLSQRCIICLSSVHTVPCLLRIDFDWFLRLSVVDGLKVTKDVNRIGRVEDNTVFK